MNFWRTRDLNKKHAKDMKRRTLDVGLTVLCVWMSQVSRGNEPPLSSAPPAHRIVEHEGLALLNRSGTVGLDLKSKRLFISSEVVLREGFLEMLACLKQTKEHESLLAVDATAQVIHAGLVSLGANVGSPATFVPQYQAATGQQIDIFLTWKDSAGKSHRDPAQSWVRHATRRYFVEAVAEPPKNFSVPPDEELKWDEKHNEVLWFGHMSESRRDGLLQFNADATFQKVIRRLFQQSQIRQLEGHWVFTGSQFATDDKTGQKYYLAESGDLICVANFATATLDLAIESSATNDTLMFEAFTERIPPLGTNVTIELVPSFPKLEEGLPAEKPK